MNVKELRKKLMLTQGEFARLLGITRMELYNWEKEKTEPHPKNMRKLSEIEKQYNEGTFKYEKN